MRKVIYRTLGILITLAATWYGYRFIQQLPERQEKVATAKVLRGDVVIRAYSRGELRAVRSVTLTAPNLFGTVQVTRLAPVGSLAKEKDLIVEFDDSERRAALEETLLEVEQIDEQIKKAQADLSIRDNQDAVDLLRTRYAVRRAELEVKRNEILSAIDAKKNVLTLEEQRRSLQQLQSDIQSRRKQARAQLAVLREQRNKSMIDVAREKQRIAQAKVLSPMTGLVAIRQNRTGFFMFGQQVPDIREGDTLRPGIPVADILDLSELEVVAKVGELDRANLHEGQDVLMTLDAVPEKHFRGKIKSMSGTASSNVFLGDPAKKFDVVFSIDMRQLMSSLGVKQEEINRIMETAERNAKKTPPPAAPDRRGRRAGAMTMPDASNGAAPNPSAGTTRGGGRNGAPVAGLARPGGQSAQQGRGTSPGGPAMDFLRFASAGTRQFTEEDRAKAQLPLPPEDDSQLKVLLRPGLLADVEIIVEKIPKALHVPVQAIFEKEGKAIVYVQHGNNFEERPVQLAKRSETVMVLSGGVQPGEIVALSDPFARKGAQKNERKKGGGAMGALPGADSGRKGK